MVTVDCISCAQSLKALVTKKSNNPKRILGELIINRMNKGSIKRKINQSSIKPKIQKTDVIEFKRSSLETKTSV